MSVCSVTCCRDVLAFSEEDPLQREETQGECAGLLPEMAGGTGAATSR